MTTELQAAAAEIKHKSWQAAPSSDDADKALARAARNIGWLEALPPYGDKDTRKAAADDMCRALEELRAHIAALEEGIEALSSANESFAKRIANLATENKRLRAALDGIATTSYCVYDGNRPYVSDHDSGYAMGVADGHRLAAKWAQEALAQAGGRADE